MITVSLCVIARDEEQTLARCLRSVAGVADEVIVVDTGSVDRTKEIAAECGARVVDFAWIDDFAAARNFSFDQAGMEFVLWLDADDVLLTEDRKKLMDLKATLDPTVDAVSMVYNTAFDAAGNVIASARRFRLVRRSLHARWVGVVHEDLEFSAPFHALDSDIVVTHQKPQQAGPSRRNLMIYEKHIQAGRPLRATDIFHYARELQMDQQFAKAIPYHEQFLRSDATNVDLTLFTLHNLATCYFMTGDLGKEWECMLRSLEFDAPRPEFSCRFGERFVQKNQFREAIFWYEAALGGPGAAGGEWAVHNHAYRTWLPHKQLGLCYFQVGEYQKSLDHNRLARQYLPDDPEVNANIAMLEQLIAEGLPR